MPRSIDLSSLASGTLDTLRLLTRHRNEIVPRARYILKKLPDIREGLKVIGKNDKNEVLSIGTFLERNARERPNDPAILFDDRRISNREFDELANRWANVYAANGVGKGDAVAIFCENRPELMFAVAGAVKLGAIAGLINTRQRKHVLVHSFGLCNAKMFVVGEELWDAFSEVRNELANGSPRSAVFVSDGGARACPDNAVDADKAVAESSPSRPPLDVRLGDPCFYIYTSGTTGLPKASVMTHFRWVKASGAFGKLALDLDPGDIIYVPLPFYHNNALTVTWSSAAANGAGIAIRRKFSASQFWDDVRRYNARAFCYIGELCRYLMNQPSRPDDRDNPAQKMIGNGLRPDIWVPFKERFGVDEVYEFYAASEGNIAFVNVFNFDCTIGFCPAPYALVKYDIDMDEPVRTADGFLQRVGRGETGLLIAEVSEKYAFDGYTDKAASEKKLLRDVFKKGDVWFNSGDLLRDQGFRHAQFVDRVGDTFRWKAENVSTMEVAEVLSQLDQVEEATVYGVQIPGADGRAGMASLVARVSPAEFDFGALLALVREQLPPYAWPLFFRFRTALDTTGTFKQMKGDLKKEGFDPSKVHEPLYVLVPRSDRYQPMTADIYARIQSGDIAF